MRLPHFVKTSCGTPSRKLFRSGLPAHRHRREGWLGHTRGNGGAPHFHFGKSVDFPKWLQNIDNVLRHKYVSLFVQSVRIPNKKNTPVGCFFYLVGAHGLEPRYTESESAVLPLNYAPMPGYYMHINLNLQAQV